MKILHRLILLISILLGGGSDALASSLTEAKEAFYKGDYKRHVQLLEELGRQGNGEALDKLGCLYATGTIVELNPKKAHELFIKGYSAGSLLSLCHLGWCYYDGLGVQKNSGKAKDLWQIAELKGFNCAPTYLAYYYSGRKEYVKAVALVKKSVACGCTEALCNLSYMYANGLGVVKDQKKAHKLTTDAAEAGLTKAIYELAYNYRHGEGGLPKDPKLAKFWAEKGITKGDGNCQALLAGMYVFGNGADANVGKGLELYRKAVEQRVPSALLNLGHLYASGTYVERNKAKARELIQLAVDRDYGPAQVELGEVIWGGLDGSKPDPKAAFALFLKAAEQGDDSGQYYVGRAFQDGSGVARDSKAARTWYERAIKNGNPHACNQLSMMYLDGTTDGIAKNVKEGMRLRVEGAKLGCPFAQKNLARDYEKGDYFEVDMKQAVYWYKKAADQYRDPWPPYRLGQLYEIGDSVPKDRSLAISYYKRAAKLGNENAKKRLRELGEK